jgi:hypothetical protein
MVLNRQIADKVGGRAEALHTATPRQSMSWGTAHQSPERTPYTTLVDPDVAAIADALRRVKGFIPIRACESYEVTSADGGMQSRPANPGWE